MTNPLRIIPLGGLGEIGKNMMLYEYGRNIMIVDAGMMIPEHDMWGIDLVIPDFSYLREKADQVRGHRHHPRPRGPYRRLALSVGQGVSPVGTPIYGTRLACGLIEAKLAEHHLLRPDGDQAHAIPATGCRVGPFEVELLAITHSIPDGVGLAIDTRRSGASSTPATSSSTTRPSTAAGPTSAVWASSARKACWRCSSDSTGAERAGYTPSEQIIEPAFDQIFRDAPGRIIVATFASLLSRVQQVINAAQRHGRVVALAGYSMLKTAEIARDLGYLDVPPGVLVDLYETRAPARRPAW